MVQALRRHGLGQVLDIVPNHVAISRETPWWWDVLENGPCSRYAPYFDVEWDPPEAKLRDRVRRRPRGHAGGPGGFVAASCPIRPRSIPQSLRAGGWLAAPPAGEPTAPAKFSGSVVRRERFKALENPSEARQELLDFAREGVRGGRKMGVPMEGLAVP